MPLRTVLVEVESDEPCGVLIAEIERNWKILEATLTLELEAKLTIMDSRPHPILSSECGWYATSFSAIAFSSSSLTDFLRAEERGGFASTDFHAAILLFVSDADVTAEALNEELEEAIGEGGGVWGVDGVGAPERMTTAGLRSMMVEREDLVHSLCPPQSAWIKKKR